MKCDNVINYQRYERREGRKATDTVFVYRCNVCDSIHRLRATCFVGLERLPGGDLVPRVARPGRGGFVCGRETEPKCEPFQPIDDIRRAAQRKGWEVIS